MTRTEYESLFKGKSWWTACGRPGAYVALEVLRVRRKRRKPEPLLSIQERLEEWRERENESRYWAAERAAREIREARVANVKSRDWLLVAKKKWGGPRTILEVVSALGASESYV